MKMRIFQRGLILVGIPLVLELVLIFSLSFLIYQSVQQRAIETKYRRFSSHVANLMSYISSAPLVLATSVQYHSKKLLHEYERESAQIRSSLSQTKEIMASIPEISREKVVDLDTSVKAILKLSDDIAAHSAEIEPSMSSLEQIQGFQENLMKAKQAVALHLDEIFDLSDQMTSKAQTNLDRTRQMQFVILGWAFGLNFVMAFGLALFYKRGIVDRINTIARNTESLSKKEDLAAPIGGQDEIAEFDCAFHSMLEQLMKAAQNEQELFENASDVICVLDSNFRFLRVSPASVKDWGVEPDQIIGKSLGDILDSSDINSVNSRIQESIEKGSATVFETRISYAGQSKTGLWSVYWSKDEQKLFCIVHDITERKQIENAKKHFMTLISSDLRIPLTKIGNCLNKLPELTKNQISDLGRDRTLMAQKNVDRLLSLVNDLLQVTQMESGVIEIYPELTSVQEIFERAVADVEQLANAKFIKIEMSACNLQIYADPGRIMQVLVNLLSNAIKFSPEHKKIFLNAELHDGFVRCSVRDEGRGIPTSHLSSVFEKFSQVEKQDGKRKAGTGLGLPICKRIIEEHGGSIGVASEEDKGADFWFQLPSGDRQFNSLEKQKYADEGTVPDTERNDYVENNSAESTIITPTKAPFGTVLPLSSKGFLLIGLPVIFELLLVAILSNSLLKIEQDRSRELHMRQMAIYASRVSKAVLYTTSVVAATETEAWNAMQVCYKEWANAQRELEKLVDDDPFAKREFEKLQVLTRKVKLYRNKLVQQKYEDSAMGFANALAEKMKFLPVCVGITRHLRTLVEHAEHEEFLNPEKQLQMLKTQFGLLGLGVILTVAAGYGLATFFSLGFSKRILIMANNANRLANDEPLNPVMGGMDELARLDAAFHETANALAQARKKERAIFDNSKDVLCILSSAGTFVSVNAAAEESWGYTKKELLNNSLESLILPEDLLATKSVLLASFDSGHGIAHECRMLTKTGNTIHALWSASRKADQSNTFCIVHDLEDKKALERMRQEFLAMVSHDLRTPLTAINGIAQLMQHGTFGHINDQAAACLTEITRNVHALLELISDILDLEKLDAGKMNLSVEAIQIEDLCELIRKHAGTIGTRLSFDLSGNTLPDVHADKERLCHALVNLCKYLCYRVDKPSELAMSFSQNNGNIQISISGSGPSIPDNIREHLFERIKEVHATEILSEPTFHADLALPLSAKTIESHGGSIKFDEIESKNVFIVVLPKG